MRTLWQWNCDILFALHDWCSMSCRNPQSIFFFEKIRVKTVFLSCGCSKTAPARISIERKVHFNGLKTLWKHANVCHLHSCLQSLIAFTTCSNKFDFNFRLVYLRSILWFLSNSPCGRMFGVCPSNNYKTQSTCSISFKHPPTFGNVSEVTLCAI